MSHHLVGMAEIAKMLGVSRQRVSQLIASYDDFPEPEVELAGGRVWDRTAVETWIADHPDRGPGRPETTREPVDEGTASGGGLFTRFTELARDTIVKAQEEARLFHHNYIGTEHLLLGLMAIEDGVAWRVLRSLDVSIDVLREYLMEMIGEGTEAPHGHIPFTPRAKKVLELALREALQLNHNHIGTEHILLALVREGEGVAWQMLAKAGLKKSEVRAAVVRQTGIHVAVEQELPLRKVRGRARRGKIADLMKCSFCTKTQSEVEKLVAGPGVFICNECIDLCNQIIAEEPHETTTPAAPSDVVSRLEHLESRIAELELRPDD